MGFLVVAMLVFGCKSHCEKTCECTVKKHFAVSANKVSGGPPAQLAAYNRAMKDCTDKCELTPNGCVDLDKSCCP